MDWRSYSLKRQHPRNRPASGLARSPCPVDRGGRTPSTNEQSAIGQVGSGSNSAAVGYPNQPHFLVSCSITSRQVGGPYWHSGIETLGPESLREIGAHLVDAGFFNEYDLQSVQRMIDGDRQPPNIRRTDKRRAVILPQGIGMCPNCRWLNDCPSCVVSPSHR